MTRQRQRPGDVVGGDGVVAAFHAADHGWRVSASEAAVSIE